MKGIRGPPPMFSPDPDVRSGSWPTLARAPCRRKRANAIHITKFPAAVAGSVLQCVQCLRGGNLSQVHTTSPAHHHHDDGHNTAYGQRAHGTSMAATEMTTRALLGWTDDGTDDGMAKVGLQSDLDTMWLW